LDRQKQIMELQQAISLERNQSRIGNTYQVLVDSWQKESGVFIARTNMDAPEIDNEVLISGDAKVSKPGQFAMVEIIDASEYELYARFI